MIERILKFFGCGKKNKKPKEKQVEVGQIWVDEEFDPLQGTVYEVILIRGEFVHYRWHDLNVMYTSVTSCPIHAFKRQLTTKISPEFQIIVNKILNQDSYHYPFFRL